MSSGFGRSGWSALTVEALGSLDAQDFEEFAYEIVNIEVCDRHHVHAELAGPSRRATRDGGRDFLLETKNPPEPSKQQYQRQYSLKPLTEDAIGRTAYSCKTGTRWIDGALKDAKKRGQRAVEVLAGGGYFKLLLSTAAQTDQRYKRDNRLATVKEHLVAAFMTRLPPDNPHIATLTDRIEIIDARKLHTFLLNRAPEQLLTRWAEQLQLVKMLRSYDEWRAYHDADRQQSKYEEDRTRQIVAEKLLQRLNQSDTEPSSRITWIIGRSGDGKTRLVLEALDESPILNARLRAATRPAEAEEAFQNRFFNYHPDAIVVVDDCPERDVGRLESQFAAAASNKPNAHLVIITPIDQPSRASTLEPLQVARLANDNIRALVRSAVRELADDELGHVIALVEGSPWLALLLAQEIRQEHRAPKDLAQAVNWVLASDNEAGGVQLDELRLERCRALALVALTHDMDWDNASLVEQNSMAAAVDATAWATLRVAAQNCQARGLVRLRLGWHYKYVTPSILEREVLLKLFGPNPSSPDPGARRLTQRSPQLAEPLFERWRQLKIPMETAIALAQTLLTELAAVLTLGSLGAHHFLGARLDWLVEYLPDESAHQLRRIVDCTSDDELTHNETPRHLVTQRLRNILGRHDGFANAEATLIKLAMSESGSLNTPATDAWSEIFLVELNFTHRTLADRLRLLKRRLNDSSAKVRAVALVGLSALLATRSWRLNVESKDGQPSPPTIKESLDARTEAWTLLTAAMLGEYIEQASAARVLAIDVLPSSIAAGLAQPALQGIIDAVGTFDETQLIALRDVLAQITHYDTTHAPHAEPLLEQLRIMTAPRSFAQRLHDQVGRWAKAIDYKKSEAEDRALAEEGVRGDCPMQAELGWLFSTAARRARPFAYALGCVDHEQQLIDSIVDLAHDSSARSIAMSYFCGLATSSPKTQIAALVDELLSNDATYLLGAMLVPAEALTAERIALLSEHTERLDAAALSEFSRRPWAASVDATAARQLIVALLEDGRAVAAEAAIEALNSWRGERPAALDAHPQLLEQAVIAGGCHPLSPMGSHAWEQLAMLQLNSGEVMSVTTAALNMIAARHGRDSAWIVLHAAAKRDSQLAWNAISQFLERDDPSVGRALIAFSFARVPPALPAEQVLSWVDHDERRARLVTSLIRPYSSTLHPILRELVIRFGASSSVAAALETRMHSSDGVVASFADDDTRKIEYARCWARDKNAQVRRFAERVVRSVQASHERHSAIEEAERARYGT